MSQIAGFQDFRQQGPPADIGTFQIPTGVMVFQHTFAGTDYFVAMRSGVRSWVLVDMDTDYATVVNNAIVDAGGRGGEIVHLAACPAGVSHFEVTTEIVDGGYDNIVLEGEGRNTVLRLEDGNVALSNIIHLNAVSGWTLRDFLIDGNKANNPVAGVFTDLNGIFLEGVCTSIDIVNVKVEFCRWNGILIGEGSVPGDKATKSQYVRVIRCNLYQNNHENLHGKGCRDVIVADCVAREADPDSETPDGHGIVFRGSERVVIEGNLSIDNDLDGICWYNSDYLTITHNICIGNPNNGIVGSSDALGSGTLAEGSSTRITITGNVCDSRIYTAGIADYHMTYVSIVGNMVSDTPSQGIFCEYTDYVTIDGNVVNNTSNRGITVEHATYASIGDNVIHAAGVYGIGVWNTTYATVTGNNIHDAVDHGIYFYTSDYFTVTGNIIHSCPAGKHGIRIYDSSYGTINGNLSRENGGYGISEEGTSDNNTIVSNDLRGNTTGALAVVGAATRVQGNRGNVGFYQSADYGVAWVNWVAGITGVARNGTTCVFHNTNGALNRLGCYSNGAWHYVDLT